MNEFAPRTRNIMVCVTRQKSCDRLISRGEALCGGNENSKLHVVHCVQIGRNFLGNPYEGEALEYLFTAAQLCGADLSMLRTENVEDALVEFAETHDINVIVLGATNDRGETIITRLQHRLPNVSIDIVD